MIKSGKKVKYREIFTQYTRSLILLDVRGILEDMQTHT